MTVINSQTMQADSSNGLEQGFALQAKRICCLGAAVNHESR